MSGRPTRVAVLGGGMAGLTAAWRLSEAGWRDELESITVYQRGWRLGGKGASSRGPNGRVEEHGLHLWLGYYENAFRLLRECYAELDRPHTDPEAPIQTWRDAFFPAATVGLEDRRADGWHHWLGQFTPNDLLPGEPDGTRRELTLGDVLRRALQLIVDFLDSLPDDATASGAVSLTACAEAPAGPSPLVNGVRVTVLAAILEAATLARGALDRSGVASSVRALDRALAAAAEAIAGLVEGDADLRRTWHLVAVMTAVARGMLADGIVSGSRGFRALNDEDFLDWIARHGAPPEVADFPFIRGLYDLVFAEGGAARSRRGVSAGVAVFLSTKMFFEYRGAIFWKMAAGMGDVVFAPLYQALRARGVRFELFHRVDGLHLSSDRARIEAITVGRQARVAPGLEAYEPLARFGGLPGFPSTPARGTARRRPPGSSTRRSSRTSATGPTPRRASCATARTSTRSSSPSRVGMAPIVCGELIDDRREWRAMVEHVTTTATQALQLWLRDDEPALGWPDPGATVSAYEPPFNTWASMPQLIDVEQWPAHDRPGSIAYFCGALEAPWPPDAPARRLSRRAPRARARQRRRLVERTLGAPAARHAAEGTFRWDLLCGATGTRAPRDRHPALPRQRRSLRPLRAVRARHRRLPAARRRERIRQPRPRRRLDRQRPERRLHRGGGRSPGCRPPTPSSDARAATGSPARGSCDRRRPGLEARRTGLEVALLGQARGPPRRGAVAVAGCAAVAGHLEQVRAHRVEAVVAGQAIVAVQRGQQLQPGPRALDHRDRHGVVERDHRVGRDRARAARRGRGSAASRCPRRGRRLVVDRGDRRLQLVRAERARRARGDQRDAFVDRRPRPRGRGPARRAARASRRPRCGPARRASVSSISASSPATSPSSGSSACTARVSRIASRVELAALQVGPGLAV